MTYTVFQSAYCIAACAVAANFIPRVPQAAFRPALFVPTHLCRVIVPSS